MAQVRKSVSLGLTLAIAGIALPAGTAVASSGVVTRAEASADWTQGQITGWAEWTGCEHWVSYGGFPGEGYSPPPYCGWIPYATVGPGSEAAECASNDRRLSSLGEDVTLAWSGEERTRYYPDYSETVEFDVSEVPLDGGAEQLVCLSLIEIAPTYVICIQIFPSPCPPYRMASFRHNLDSATMLVSSQTEPPSEEEGEAGEEESESTEEIDEPENRHQRNPKTRAQTKKSSGVRKKVRRHRRS